jgi:hypothetical protein
MSERLQSEALQCGFELQNDLYPAEAPDLTRSQGSTDQLGAKQPCDLTSSHIAELLDAAYRQDRRLPSEGVGWTKRGTLANYLGCHPEALTKAWAAWQEILAEGGDVDEDEAQYWLNVEFVKLRPKE